MPVKRFDVGSWLDSPLSRRRLDLTQFATERAAVAEICARVLAEGDEALRDLGRRFDGWAPAPGESFEVPPHKIATAADRLPPADRAALEFAARRIRDFHERQAEPGSVGLPGLKLVTRPVRRAGVYAPGGRAAYPSTVLMTVIPARVAGVPEVVLATPPRPDGTVPSSILAAAHIAGVDAVYRVGVAQAMEQAMHVANDFAPEHLLIVAGDAARLAAQVQNAGAVFVGAYATVPLGDYSAGPNHTLPTSGAARFSSPLGVHTFLKRTSVLSLNRNDTETLRDASVRLAEMEGLGAHAHAIEVRLE